MMNGLTVSQRIWRFCCSLKLAIVLASAATLLAIGGSLAIHFHPRVFGNLDTTALGTWLVETGREHPGQAWWIWLTGLLLLLLGINTLCCFVDWLLHLQARWRKLGEYLIHLGFVLFVAAFLWGSVAGYRTDSLRLFVGELTALPGYPGHYLRLDRFEPVMAESGRPIDMLSDLTLLQGETVLVQTRTSINHPLLYQDLVVPVMSFGQAASGFQCLIPDLGMVELAPGRKIQLAGGGVLEVLEFLPDAMLYRDRWVARSDRLQDPAFLLRLTKPGYDSWQGWYPLRGELPFPLVQRGVRIWPRQPIFATYSLVRANRDPGAAIALAGGVCLLAGALFALVSFYRKRSRGDRPEVN